MDWGGGEAKVVKQLEEAYSLQFESKVYSRLTRWTQHFQKTIEEVSYL
jgi:hypothetical protein